MLPYGSDKLVVWSKAIITKPLGYTWSNIVDEDTVMPNVFLMGHLKPLVHWIAYTTCGSAPSGGISYEQETYHKEMEILPNSGGPVLGKLY